MENYNFQNFSTKSRLKFDWKWVQVVGRYAAGRCSRNFSIEVETFRAFRRRVINLILLWICWVKLIIDNISSATSKRINSITQAKGCMGLEINNRPKKRAHSCMAISELGSTTRSTVYFAFFFSKSNFINMQKYSRYKGYSCTLFRH